jgi:hypothetical protein
VAQRSEARMKEPDTIQNQPHDFQKFFCSAQDSTKVCALCRSLPHRQLICIRIHRSSNSRHSRPILRSMVAVSGAGNSPTSALLIVIYDHAVIISNGHRNKPVGGSIEGQGMSYLQVLQTPKLIRQHLHISPLRWTVRL